MIVDPAERSEFVAESRSGSQTDSLANFLKPRVVAQRVEERIDVDEWKHEKMLLIAAVEPAQRLFPVTDNHAVPCHEPDESCTQPMTGTNLLFQLP
jgi:hypothetical protein